MVALSTSCTYDWYMDGPTSDQEGLLAWASVVHAREAVAHVVERRLQERAGVPLAGYEVLVRLSHEPEGACRMHDLTRPTLLSKSGLTRLIDRMERDGLVRRTSDDADRRGTLAVLTPKGRRTLDRSRPVFLDAIREHFSRHLTQADAGGLRRVLRKVLAANGHADDPACSRAEDLRVS
jgi:DNA-binding MarR family transcriptional regulator